jgi:hypothetical protein
LKVDLGEEDWFAVEVVNALVEPGVPVERPEGVVAILDTETIIVEREGVEQSVNLLWPQRFSSVFPSAIIRLQSYTRQTERP